MGKLSKSKLRFIRNNQGRLTFKEMAVKLGISVSDVKRALEDREESVSVKGEPLNTAIFFTFYVLLLVSPLLYYPRIQDFSNLPKSYFIHVASCLLLILWLFKSRLSGKIEIVRHPLIICIGLWLLWSGATIFWSADKFGGISLWLHWFMCAICFFVFINSARSTAQLDKIVFFSVLGAALISGLGIFQYALGWDFIPQGGIPGATFSNKNVAVQFMVIVWPLSLLLFLLGKERNRCLLYAFIHSLLVIFLLYSRTRAGWIALFFSLWILILFISATRMRRDIRSFITKEKAIVFICSIIFVAGMAMVPQKTSPGKGPSKGYLESLASISGYEGEDSSKVTTTLVRLAMWRNSIDMIRDNSLLGVGLAAWHIHYPRYQNSSITDPIFSNKEQPFSMHNDPLQILAEISVLGFILYASMFVVILWRSLKAFRATDDAGVRLRIVFGITAIIAFTINSLFTFPLRMAIPPLFLMIVFGFLVSLDLHAMEEARQFLFPIKDYALSSLIVLVALFAVLLMVFDSRIILADYYYLRSSYFNRIKNWNLARAEALKAVDYIPWRHKLWFELGKATDHLGLDDEAIEAYSNALKAHPNHLNSFLNLGHIYLKSSNFEKAAHYTMEALRIKPDFDLALFNMGLMNERQGQTREAASYYQEAISANPKYAQARFLLGLIYLKENSLDKAKEQLEKAAELEPDVSGIHFNLGLVYDRLDMPENAAAEYRKEITLNPEGPEAYTNLGLIYAKQEKWEEAISYYKEAIRLDPDLGAAHVNIAVAYYMLGDYEASWRHARIGEDLGLPQARTLIQRLKEVRPLNYS